jgi:hypothetical protein
MKEQGPAQEELPALHRFFASSLFNRVWDLLEEPDRSEAEDEEMLYAAHASRYHWGVVGEPVNLVRGEWQVSCVYAVLKRGSDALHHAQRSLACAASTGSKDSTWHSPMRRWLARRRFLTTPPPANNSSGSLAPRSNRSRTPRTGSGSSRTWRRSRETNLADLLRPASPLSCSTRADGLAGHRGRRFLGHVVELHHIVATDLAADFRR